MAPSAERDYTLDDETATEASSSPASSSPMRVHPSPGPSAAKRTRINKGLNANNIISTPRNGSSRLKKKNDQPDADQSPTPEGRRTRGSFASDQKKINYDMRHHPVDDVLRPKATAKRTGRAVKSESQEEAPQSTYKKRHTSPIIKIRKRHTSESLSPDRRHSARFNASGRKTVNYDTKHHPMDDVLHPKAPAKKSVQFTDPHARDIAETPSKTSVKRRKGIPLPMHKRQEKIVKGSRDQREVSIDAEASPKHETVKVLKDVRDQKEAMVTTKTRPKKDDLQTLEVSHKLEEPTIDAQPILTTDSLGTASISHKQKRANANTEMAPANEAPNGMGVEVLINPFDLTLFTTWRDLKESDRCIYLLQKGAPLDTETLPLDWSTVGSILVTGYMSKDHLTAIGGLAAIQIRYEQIRVEMQQYFEAAPEPAYEEDWRPMYMEDFDVYDLKGSATKYWKPSDANLVPRRNLRAFEKVGTIPDENTKPHEDCNLEQRIHHLPENLPTPTSMDILMDQATNLSGLGIHETAEQVATNLMRSELCGEIESLMSSREVSNAFEEHANETNSSIDGAKSDVPGDSEALQSNVPGNGMVKALQTRQDMEGPNNGGVMNSLDATKIVEQTEAEDSQRTALAKKEGLYPILQYNLLDSESSSRKVEEHTAGDPLVGRSEQNNSEEFQMVLAGPVTTTNFAAPSFTAINSGPLLEEGSVLKAYTTALTHDVAHDDNTVAQQLLQEIKLHNPQPKPKPIGNNPSIPTHPSGFSFSVHEDQTGRTPIIQKIIQKHPISPGTDVPKENLNTSSTDETGDQEETIPRSTGRPAPANRTSGEAGYQSLFGGPLAQNPVTTANLPPSTSLLSAASSVGTEYSVHTARSRSGTYSERVVRGRAPRAQMTRPRASEWIQ